MPLRRPRCRRPFAIPRPPTARECPGSAGNAEPGKWKPKLIRGRGSGRRSGRDSGYLGARSWESLTPAVKRRELLGSGGFPALLSLRSCCCPGGRRGQSRRRVEGCRGLPCGECALYDSLRRVTRPCPSCGESRDLLCCSAVSQLSPRKPRGAAWLREVKLQVQRSVWKYINI